MSHQPAQVAPSNENKMALSLSFSLSFCDKWCSSGCLPDVWPGWSPRPEPGSYYFLFFALFWLRKIFFFVCVCAAFFSAALIAWVCNDPFVPKGSCSHFPSAFLFLSFRWCRRWSLFFLFFERGGVYRVLPGSTESICVLTSGHGSPI